MVEAKTVDKKITAAKKVLRKELSKQKKTNVKQSIEMKKQKKTNVEQSSEIEKLKSDINMLKKKKKFNTSHVSEYNIFIRKQIRSGLTFLQAVKQWNRYKSLESRNKRRPSAYNQFIGSQMRLGKTWKQSVALWKLAKAGKLGKKGSTKTITKTVVRTRTIKSKPTIKYRTRTITSKPKIKYRTRTITSKPTIKYRTRTITSKPKIKYRTRTIESKPKIKYRTRTKTVVKVKRVNSKPKVVVKKVRVRSKPKVVTKIKYRTKSAPQKVVTRVVERGTGIDAATLHEMISSLSTKSVSSSSSSGVDDEAIAFRVIQTYFSEVARFGMKKQLSLDEIINAYFYALARVKRKETSYEVDKSLRETGMKK